MIDPHASGIDWWHFEFPPIDGRGAFGVQLIVSCSRGETDVIRQAIEEAEASGYPARHAPTPAFTVERNVPWDRVRGAVS